MKIYSLLRDGRKKKALPPKGYFKLNLVTFQSKIACFFYLSVFTVALPAHEHFLLEIGGKDIQLVIGSLNEPIYVDDKSGVDLSIQLADPKNPMDFSSPLVQPILDLEKTLKVAVGANKKSKILEISPVWNKPGRYKAVYYPTSPGVYSYRVFGTINEVPIDLIFPCQQTAIETPADSTIIQLAPGIIQKYKEGAFGCPALKGELDFPEKTFSALETAQQIQQLKIKIDEPEIPLASLAYTQPQDKQSFGMIFAILLATISLIVSLFCFYKISKK